MVRKICLMPISLTLYSLPLLLAFASAQAPAQRPATFAFVNGQWFNGTSFDRRAVYSVDGRLTRNRPARVERTLDLSGSWVVPPFADAHNHSIGTGVEERDRAAIRRFIADGVFYVKMQGNLPLTNETKARLGLNRADSVDAVFAQGSLTATGGHPTFLVGLLLKRGLFPGHTPETLKDLRYFTIDSEADLDKKWPLIVGQRPDFVKTFLLHSEQFEERKSDPAVGSEKGLDPRLLPRIVERAHASNLKVSTHVRTAADFHNALVAGVDEMAHIPSGGGVDATPIAVEDVRLAARRGVVVDTTLLAPITGAVRAGVAPESAIPAVRRMQLTNLKLLSKSGVRLAVGSDDPEDSSIDEFFYLKSLGVLDNLALLKMWTETAQTIFPARKIGALEEGYEASFLALEGNPLDDLEHVRRIRLRFKQGVPLQ